MAPQPIPPKLTGFDQLPDSSLVDVKVLSGIFACSVNTVWRRYGRLAIKVSPQQTRWRVGDVRRLLAALSNPSEAA
jgi:hypothetical protein